ncbi:MAG: polymer-forming cytoskeletal protein [Lachnospiraceae bacterium]|nr:polymer-forming cytoskeletal protein [Lachnospiraceae bacterium]
MQKKKELQITTLVGKGAELKGDFHAPGSARIDGTVDGNVTVENVLVLGASGVINGNIAAAAVYIGGEVNGNIQAPEKAELTASAKVIGDISTESIVIDEHAIFQGGCNMNQEVPERKGPIYRKAVRTGKKSAAEAVAAALKEVREEQSKEEESPEQESEPSAE